VHTNAHELVNKRQELNALINFVKDYPHVIAVTEIKPKNLSQQLLTGEFNLPGYNIFTHGLDDPTKRGLLLYISVDIEASLVDVSSAFRECLFVLLKNRSKTNTLLVGNIYRSPNSSEENDINLHQMFKYIDQNYKFSKLIMGDFNFPNIHWYPVQTGATARCSGLSDKEMKFVNTLRENSPLQHVVSPTRQRGSDAPHILDFGGRICRFPIDLRRRPYNTLALPCECVIVYCVSETGIEAINARACISLRLSTSSIAI